MHAVRPLRAVLATAVLLFLLELPGLARAATPRTAPAKTVERLAPAGLSLRPRHPKHDVRYWKARYRGRTFHVTELPRCEHVEAVFSYDTSGETQASAKRRLHGIAACTGSFHDPRTMALADFLQRDGTIVSGATTGRWFFAATDDGEFTISDDYSLLKGQRGVSAIALGQRLVPLHRDGFSKAFMNEVTERMALGLTRNHIYIVEAKSNLWLLSAFLQRKLGCSIAINSDGGHVVQGRAPVHIVFRWRKNRPMPPVTFTARAKTPSSTSPAPRTSAQAQPAAGPQAVSTAPIQAATSVPSVSAPEAPPQDGNG